MKLNEQPMDNTPILPTEEKILTDTDAEDSQYTMLVIEDNRDIATYIGEVLSNATLWLTLLMERTDGRRPSTSCPT